MTYEITTQKNSNKKLSSFFVLVILFLVSSANAQDVLVGLTSNGGPEGRGSAFSVKTTGVNFSIIQGFADWGKSPNGDLLLNSDGNFYGMAYSGGTYGSTGTIFRMTSSGMITVLKQLNGTVDGQNPYGELIKGADGNFYGMTNGGGSSGYGVIFKITPAGDYSVLKNFSLVADGGNPRGHLVLAKDGNFYGITYSGGANGAGTVFRMTSGGGYTVIHSMNNATEGGNSFGSLTEGIDGKLYGITYGGGQFGTGTIFQITTAGNLIVLKHLNAATDGGSSQGDLIQATDGNFYGMCYNGGANGNGTIFKITPGGNFSVVRSLAAAADGGNPYGNLFQNSDGFLYGMTRTGGAKSAGTIFKISTGGNFTFLHSFDPAIEGGTANGSLVKGNDGNLYGMTNSGGANLWGTAFKVTTAGAVTVLVNFHGATLGNTPFETLVKGKDSAYYGTTSAGGKYNYGTIVRICGGTTTLLYSFNKSTDGGTPKGSLVFASDSNFYGMTTEGGTGNAGTIFRITPQGNYSVIKHLNSATDGAAPQGSLVQGTDGFLYGMTSLGGTSSSGTIFKMNLTGSSFTVLHHLAYATAGSAAEGSLVQGTDGAFYGMTNNNAHMFKIASDGTFTLLHTFVSSSEGSAPLGSLVLGTDGNFYGTTSAGGTFGGGTIFKVTPSGTVSVLKQLNATPDGKTPKGSLLLANDGNFYGMTSAGGSNNVGTLFKITPSATYSVLRHFNMATDGGNPFGSLILAPVNNLVANAQSVTTPEDTKKKITLTGSGGSPLTYTIVAKPKHGKLSGTGNIRTYTPNKNYAGNDQFTFTVSVGCISSAPATVNITVTPVADTPVLAPIGNKTVVKGSTLTFTASASDPDAGQTLSFSLIGAPAGANINATTGVFSWTPATAGSFTFKVRVTDNGTPQLYDEEQITVTVTNTFAKTNGSTSQEATSEHLHITMYPNPVVDKFYITLPGAAKELSIRIVDITGIVRSNVDAVQRKNNIEVDASKLNRGLYLLQVKTEQESETIRFMKN